MPRAKTPKQLDISIRSLKKKISKLEAQKRRAVAARKKKPVRKRKPAKKKKAVRRKKRRR